MISTEPGLRPVRRPPPKPRPGAIPQPRSLPLPVARAGAAPRRGGVCGDPFDPHKVLVHFDRIERVARGELVYPITVELDPTNICNHRCRWCVSVESHNGEQLSLVRMAALAAELRECDVRSVVLKGGGEPSAHPRFVDVLRALREQKLAIGIITNGSFPRPGSLEAVLECCDWVRISLDAATAETHRRIHGSGDFEKIVTNARYLAAQSAHTMVGLNFVAEESNRHEMAAFAELARSVGAAYVTIRCVFDVAGPPPEEARREMREQAKLAKALETEHFRVFLGNFTDRYLSASRDEAPPAGRCMGPNLIGIVGGDGHVYACCFLRGNRSFSFGNINEQSFREIWRSERRQQVMQAVYGGACNQVCAGGTTGNRYDQYNEILNYLAAEEKMHTEFA